MSKAAGEKWRAMSDQEKQPYVDQAGQKKQDYEKTKANFDKKESTSSKKAKTEDEDGSKSEVDDEDGSSDEENDDDE